MPIEPAALRAALPPKAACAASEKQCGKRLPQQTYAILPKTREVDTVLRSSADLRERVFVWTAGRIHAGECVHIPEDVDERDEYGLPMRMLA